MSKIICDVCGTSYPETATQCPICGCVRPGEANTVAGDTNISAHQEAGTYTYVKGGRFSKSNVRKRNRQVQVTEKENDSQQMVQDEERSKTDLGLTIAVVALLLAIVAVVIYIVLHFFAPGDPGKKDPADQTTADTGTVQTTPGEESTLLEIPCTGLTVDEESITLDSVGASWLLNVKAEPLDTTDEVFYSSSDEAVVTVTSEGKITAVAAGSAKITVVCGKEMVICDVICDIPEETEPSTEPSTEPETEPPTFPVSEFELNREDFSLFYRGETWDVYSGSIDASQIVWTSDNESVATVTDGVVVAVGPGDTTIHGEYNGVKKSCAVRCKFTVTETGNNTGDADNAADVPIGTTYTISHADVTLLLSVAERRFFVLTLTDAQGNPINVTWSTSSSCCTIDGNVITAKSNGNATVYTVYEGERYECIVYVRS